MNNFISYFKAGKCYNKYQAVDYIVTKFLDLTNIIIPYFIKYPIVGVKSRDFVDFCKVAELMKNKAYLTPEDLEEIRKIKMGMNRGRS